MEQRATKRVEPRRLYQQTADQIRALIRAGQFPIDTRLPAERDLAQQLGVSRPSLREALVALEIEGTVDIRMGAGVYVCATADDLANSTRALGESPSELMQARMLIEGAIVVQACARMTPAALGALEGVLERMRREIAKGRHPLGEDRLFHVTVAHQAGNAVLIRIVADLFDERHSQISTQVSAKFETRDTWLDALGEHEAIYSALEAADPILAEAAMRQHLHRSAERWNADRDGATGAR